MTTLTKQALMQRLPLLCSVPQHVVRTLPAGKVADFWEMASIGMPNTIAQKIQFAADGTLAQVSELPVAEALAAAQDAPGYLLQDDADAGVYFATAEGDIAIVASKLLCRSEDCQCG